MSRITFDYTSAVFQRAGIGRLTREMARALLLLDTPHRFKLFVMGHHGNRQEANALSPTVVRRSPITDKWLHRLWFKANVKAPIEWFAGACDLYHATDFILPPTRSIKKTVLTVHDLTFERDPSSAMPELIAFLRRAVPDSVRRATHIVADSYATARDLTELYGVAPEKITTIHCGVDLRRFTTNDGRRKTNDERRMICEKYDIGEAPFVLAVGTLQKRKNHLNLVRAFAKLIHSSNHLNHQLVIAGGKGWLYDEVVEEVRKQRLTERVKFIGYVEDDDLPALYRAARVLAFPSLYEGFGLPLLEAMACGIPVVTSNVSSLPEVVGDAGLQVNPRDVDALASALDRATIDEVWRTQAIQRGLERAKSFSWEKAARELMAVYERVLR